MQGRAQFLYRFGEFTLLLDQRRVSVAFDYGIVKRSGHENERLADVTAEMQR